MRKINIIIAIIISVVWCHVASGQVLDQTTLKIQVVAGKNAVLPCRVENLGNTRVIFSKSSTILTIGRERRTEDSRFSIHTPYEHDWNLNIRSIKRSDAGEYSCSILTTPIQKKAIHLIVQVSSQILDIETSRNMKVIEGSNVTLQCKASGLPESRYLWHYRKQGEIGIGEQIINGASGELNIYEISRDESGIYQCTAFNGIPPEDTKDIKVEVEFSPEVSLLNIEQSQFLGRNTELHCTISGHPLETTIWLKGTRELPFSDWKYKQNLVATDHLTQVLSIEIRNLDRKDFGEYTCIASNRHGLATMSMELKEAKIKTTTSTSTTTETPTTTYTTVIPSSTTTPFITSSENGGIFVDTNSSSKDPGYTVLPTLKPIEPENQETDSGSSSFNVTAVYVMVALTCKLLTL